MRIVWQRLVVIAAAIATAFVTATPILADPATERTPPFPDQMDIETWYTRLDPSEFFIANQPGVWFLSTSGLNCGMWVWGSFGCSGDIPGLPPTDRHIAWFNGNRAVHHDWTAAMQFPPGQAERTLPPLSYVSFEETICATTVEGNTYCQHGANRFLITPQGTWFKAWEDRPSQTCNAYGSCRPPW